MIIIRTPPKKNKKKNKYSMGNSLGPYIATTYCLNAQRNRVEGPTLEEVQKQKKPRALKAGWRVLKNPDKPLL